MAQPIDSDLRYDSVNWLAAGAIVFGLVSLAVCWWFPFGPIPGRSGWDGHRSMGSERIAKTSGVGCTSWRRLVPEPGFYSRGITGGG